MDTDLAHLEAFWTFCKTKAEKRKERKSHAPIASHFHSLVKQSVRRRREIIREWSNESEKKIFFSFSTEHSKKLYYLGQKTSVIFLLIKIFFNNLKCLFINLFILMTLQELNFVQAATLLDLERVQIRTAAHIGVRLSQLENIVHSIQRHLHNLGVHKAQQVAQRLYHIQLDQISNLLGSAGRSGIDDGPSGLLAGLVLASAQYFDQLGKNVRLEHHLNLGPGASSDVGNGPAGLLFDGLFGRVEQRQQTLQRIVVQYDLGLRVVAGDNVADGSERRLHHIQRAVHQELDETRTHARLNNLLDFFVGPVAQVRNGPGGVRQHVHVRVEEQSGQDGQSGLHFGELDGRVLAAAQVGQAPDGVARHGQARLLRQYVQQGRQNAVVEHQVSAFGRVAGYVAERPHGLLLHVFVRRREQLHEYGQSARLDHAAGLQRVAAGDVGERPCGLELQLVVGALQELHEFGHYACVDDLVYGRIGLFGEQLAEALGHVFGKLFNGENLKNFFFLLKNLRRFLRSFAFLGEGLTKLSERRVRSGNNSKLCKNSAKTLQFSVKCTPSKNP
ncbi:hypothetical protein BpHYR1_036413 [Brachionus plicatilis]|uniref:Uncharacterized protein n=1 Tax=Brachionus plicatilis TaxID=10195 RepID=A0A3M7SJ03_BRAPC|nr:hypothetical protein BpHYR1_036413 [Brachionus plicatilis]